MKKAMSILVGTAMLASLLAGCQGGGENTTASAEANAEEMAMQQEAQSQIVEAWGEVSAETIKEVHIDFDATVLDIYVKEGQEVKQGDKLMTLDYEEYKTSIAQKEKELSLDKKTYEGQIKSSGKTSSSCTYPHTLHTQDFFFLLSGCGLICSW